jgi:site-specific DNA-methyltransferase (adenine-specific)
VSASQPAAEPPKRKRRPTATSAFGVSRRESHDASDFYARFTAPVLSKDAEVRPCGVKDQLFVGDSRDMAQVEDKSVALVVTSPPYFAAKAYEVDTKDPKVPASYVEYLQMLHDVFAECVRVLEPGGRMAINVANLGRKPFRSLASDVTRILQDDLGLLLRGEVIWHKGEGANGSCAWGSYASASNPALRDLTERIILASKGRFDRAIKPKDRAELGLPHRSTITPEEFRALTLDVWRFNPASAKRIGHPAPFPAELPRRVIELLTYEGDVVLDPFMGSGQVAIAAVETGRHYVGYDLDESYVELARGRVAEVARPGT